MLNALLFTWGRERETRRISSEITVMPIKAIRNFFLRRIIGSVTARETKYVLDRLSTVPRRRINVNKARVVFNREDVSQNRKKLTERTARVLKKPPAGR
jgi:hypothetical protein